MGDRSRAAGAIGMIVRHLPPPSQLPPPTAEAISDTANEGKFQLRPPAPHTTPLPEETSLLGLIMDFYCGLT